MNIRNILRSSLVAVAMTTLPSTQVMSATAAQYATAVKLGLVHTGFASFGWNYSDTYLWAWQFATGSARQYPISGMNGDVVSFLRKQRAEIISTVQQRVRNGSIKQGSSVRVSSLTNGMPRPASYSDFTYAIGGCTISSYADVTVGRADSRGNVPCTIFNWSSVLTDIYKFDFSDQFYVPLVHVQYFAPGELYGFEQAGLAKKFNVSSSSFYETSLLGSFTITR